MLPKELKRRSQRLLVELNESLEDKELFRQISHCVVELRKAASSGGAGLSACWGKEAELKDVKDRLAQAEEKVKGLQTDLDKSEAYATRLAEKMIQIPLPEPFERFRVYSMTYRSVDALTLARAIVESIADPLPLRRLSRASDLYLMLFPEGDGLVGFLLTKAQFTAMTPNHIDPERAMEIMNEVANSVVPESNRQQRYIDRAITKVLAESEQVPPTQSA